MYAIIIDIRNTPLNKKDKNLNSDSLYNVEE